MDIFTPRETEFLKRQGLGHLATVNMAGEPHVVPVNYTFNALLETIDIGGYRLSNSKKYRDVARTGRAAFETEANGGITVRGRAEAISDGAMELIRLYPERVVSWGIDTAAYEFQGRTVETVGKGDKGGDRPDSI